MNELETAAGVAGGLSAQRTCWGDEDYSRFNSVLDTTRNKLFQVMEAETAEGQERLKLAQETQRATAAQDRLPEVDL
ncbi:Uncharacterised protein [Leclercia adecarboxylata]|uniref:Uncharacterized protein n=1 Tax=Leclercia adecarboxylata TaxID=83655 RepID=A0A4U9I010_9ENTR|nr:Uncharacterised protein [Leclercia adecarboxylata]